MNEPDKDAFDHDALALRDLLIQKANELREHCDSVVILCTLSEVADSERCPKCGSKEGTWFDRCLSVNNQGEETMATRCVGCGLDIEENESSC